MYKAVIGSCVVPEKWKMGNNLEEGLEGFCDFYLPVNSNGPIRHVAVNITVTGKVFCNQGGLRGQVEFVGDGEPSTYSKCIIYRAQEVI
jgi:hypothetical protein